MKENNIEIIKRIAESKDWEYFQSLIVASGQRYMKEIFEIKPELSEIKFSRKDLYIFYVKFCENIANLPKEVMQNFVEENTDNNTETDIDKYVQDAIDKVMEEAETIVNK